MSSNSQLRAGGESLRWTPAWVLTVSFLTPASAWALHSVMPDLVAWYVGIMGWLVLTPEKGMRFRLSQIQAEPVTGKDAELSSNGAGGQGQTRSIVRPESQDSAGAIENSSTETTAGKARKPRTRARKPKALTLAEVKALTSSADRAVVWSQVGPGKFVRNAGDENSENSTESDAPIIDPPNSGTQVIETVLHGSTILNSDDSDLSDEFDQV